MEKRKHADRCYELPPDLPDDMDLMIEVRFPLSLSLSSSRMCADFCFRGTGEGQGAGGAAPVPGVQPAPGHTREFAAGEGREAVPAHGQGGSGRGGCCCWG